MARRSTGFSLVEVTVAIAVIGMMIVSTGLLLERIPVGGREVRDQDTALKIARNEIESIRAGGYEALPESGPFTDTLLSALEGGVATVTVSDVEDGIRQVEVVVSWRGAGLVTRTVSLVTLVAENSGLP